MGGKNPIIWKKKKIKKKKKRLREACKCTEEIWFTKSGYFPLNRIVDQNYFLTLL